MAANARVVVITGASAGIGRATALRLGRDGWTIVACARRGDRLESLAAEIAAGGGTALPVVADVTCEADMQALVSQATGRFGRLDAIVCNAGFGVEGTIDEVDAAQMRRLMDVNYFGTYYALRAAIPVFREAGRGHAIVVSSIVGERGVPYMGAYSATKFAQVGLVECMRSELAGTNIHLSVVCPVSTETEFFDVLKRESRGESMPARGPRQSADTVAASIARCLAEPVPVVYPYPKSRALVILNALAPGFCDRFVQKFGRRREKDVSTQSSQSPQSQQSPPGSR